MTEPTSPGTQTATMILEALHQGLYSEEVNDNFSGIPNSSIEVTGDAVSTAKDI